MITKEDIDTYVRFMFNVGETRVAMETIQAIYRKENVQKLTIRELC